MFQEGGGVMAICNEACHTRRLKVEGSVGHGRDQMGPGMKGKIRVTI